MTVKRSIPPVPQGDPTRAQFDQAVKENIEILTGRRAGKVLPLASTATLNDVINKVNELIDRLQ